jgi:hypothetical protein
MFNAERYRFLIFISYMFNKHLISPMIVPSNVNRKSLAAVYTTATHMVCTSYSRIVEPTSGLFARTVRGSVGLLMFIIALLSTELKAQDAPTTLLPDIDPQDIEIRGDFVARFPGIMRQPILGFNPRPRVFQIDPNRMPFIETPEQVVASLPVSDLVRPAPPGYELYRSPARYRLWSRTGIGNYMSPIANVTAELPVARRTVLGAEFNNFSAASYLDDPQTSSFRNMDGGLNVVHYVGERSRLDVGLKGRADRNHLPKTPELWVFPGIAVPPAAPYISPDNNLNSISGQVSYRHTRNALSHSRISTGISYFKADTEYFDAGTTRRSMPEELRFSGEFEHQWTARTPGRTFTLSAGADYTTYDTDTGADGDWMLANAGFSHQRRINHAIRLSAGIRAYYGFDAASINQLYVYPELTIRYRYSDKLSFLAVAEGTVNNSGMEGHSLVNRKLYRYAAPEIERGMRAAMQGEYEVMQGFKVHSSISYNRLTKHAAYGTIMSTDLLTYGYVSDANLLRWDVSTWYDLMPDKLTAWAGLYVQNHFLDGGTEIAFRENVGFSAGGSYRLTDKSRIRLWADYVGPRTVDTNRDADGFFLLGTSFDFWASNDIGAFVKLNNILNQSYSQWVGYNELPAQIFGGVMLKF